MLKDFDKMAARIGDVADGKYADGKASNSEWNKAVIDMGNEQNKLK